MTTHTTPPLAQQLRSIAASAPTLHRPALAAAADAVEELSKLRAERDEARALLREANNWIGRDCTNVREQIAELTPLCNRIDAALKDAK